MTQFFFEARDLWAAQGVPYYEPDKIEPVIQTAIRTIIAPTFVSPRFELIADAEVATP